MYSIIIWLTGVAFYFYETTLQVSQGVLTPILIHDFNTSTYMVSLITSAYFWGYGLMQIPAGLLLDHFKTRYILVAAITLCAISCMIFSLSHSVHLAILSRFFIGIASSFAVLCCFNMTNQWFDAKRFATLTGMMLTIAMLGMMTAEYPLSVAIGLTSWRHLIFAYGLFGLVLAVASFCLVRDNPNYRRQPFDFALWLRSIKTVVSTPSLWLLALCAMMFYSAFMSFANLGNLFMLHVYMLDHEHIASIMQWIFIGFAIGAPTTGYISDRLQQRRSIMMVCSLLSTACMALIILWHHSLGVLRLLLLIYGYFTSGFLLGFTMLKEQVDRDIRISAIAFMNTLNMLGPAVAIAVCGKLIDTLSSGTVADPSAYSLVFLPIVVLSACGFLLTLFIRDQSR